MDIQRIIFEGFLNEQGIGLLIIRILVGTFFVLSGYHKLFNADRHAQLVETLRDCHVPFIRFNQWFVPGVEFFGGLAVLAGFLAPLAALGMLIILLVAILTDGLKRIPSYFPIDFADYVCCVIYLPEFLLGAMLTAILVGGPGSYSLHSFVFWFLGI